MPAEATSRPFDGLVIGPTALRSAVERGIVSETQVAALAEIVAESGGEAGYAASGNRDDEAPPKDAENLRFIGGFADVFVTIGIGLFLAALWQLSGSDTPLSMAVVAAGAWGLAEYFTRVRRMSLPSIALLVAFAIASLVGLQMLLFENLFDPAFPTSGPVMATGYSLAVAGIGTAFLTGIHYLRFRVPITVAAGVAAIAIAALVALGTVAPDFLETNISPILGAVGLIVFGLAMRFDLSDPERRTRATDIAFWLHLLAAPLLVRAILPVTVEGGNLNDWLFVDPQTLDVGTSVTMLVLFALIGVVSLVIDRRALLVSGLSFAGAALWRMVDGSGIAEETGVALTFLFLGTFILMISVGWRPLRRLLLAMLPAGLTARLPAIERR